jgi:hypothetical protein
MDLFIPVIHLLIRLRALPVPHFQRQGICPTLVFPMRIYSFHWDDNSFKKIWI